MLHHFSVHLQQDSHIILLGFALLGEVLWFPALIIMIVQGFKRKQCGMPMVGICAFGGICLIWSTFGPYVRPELFPKNAGEWTVWMWRGYLVLMGILFYQSLKFGKNQKHLTAQLKEHHTGLALSLFAFFTLTEWWFITYFLDYNMNETSPIAVLFIPFGYLSGLYLRHEYDRALRYFERVEKLHPWANKAPDALYRIGQIYLRRGDTVAAQAYFDKVREQFPETAAARLALREDAS